MVRGTLKLAPYAKKLEESWAFRPFYKFGLWYSEAAKARPFLTGFVTTGFKTTAADVFAQKVVERREEIDWRRNATFTAFGFAYLGSFQYYLYTNLFQTMCHPIRVAYGHPASVAAKVFLDQGLHHPFVYFPAFYCIKALSTGQPVYPYAVEKYQSEIWESIQACWSVWVPAQIINFAFVPIYLRIPYAAGVSFLWTVILSTTQSIFDSKRDDGGKEGQLALENGGVVIEEIADGKNK